MGKDSLEILYGKNAFIVPCDVDEFKNYQDSFLYTRNNKAKIFVLHFLPTMMCQLNCSYCFEQGAKRQGTMTDRVLGQTILWLREYFKSNPEIQLFKCVLFGGEPLLEKKFIVRALSEFSKIAKSFKKEFCAEIVTNGLLLDKDFTKILTKYNLQRVQITLDGIRDLHDLRRISHDKCPTFDRIISNVGALLDEDSFQINLRLSLDEQTADSLLDLVEYLSKLERFAKIHLSLGIITPFLNSQIKVPPEKELVDKAILVWKTAKSFGFSIPDEFAAGPWCVAIAKYSAVLQPNGALQKCFCTVGRSEFDFDTIFNCPTSTEDARFENFSRVSRCVKERCPYLPICGGGCIHDSLVAYGKKGFKERFCRRDFISRLNKGLLALNYG